MGLWRCQRDKCSDDKHGRCIHDFEAERPICDRCGTDGREFPQIVIKLELIHYEAIAGKIGEMSYGTKELACAPGKTIAAGVKRSAAARAVNCPACRKSQLWRDAMSDQGEVLEDKDYPIEIDPVKQEVRRVEAQPEPVPEAVLPAKVKTRKSG